MRTEGFCSKAIHSAVHSLSSFSSLILSTCASADAPEVRGGEAGDLLFFWGKKGRQQWTGRKEADKERKEREMEQRLPFFNKYCKGVQRKDFSLALYPDPTSGGDRKEGESEKCNRTRTENKNLRYA